MSKQSKAAVMSAQSTAGGNEPAATTGQEVAVAATEPAAAEATEAPAPADPFADLPVVTLNGTEVQDLTDLGTSNPRKYTKVAEAATAIHMPVMIGWKHEEAVFIPGSGPERKPGSVWGTIVAVVAAAGRAGINSYELCNAVRVKQVGNKRSHFCEQLPPVGWAEGWINSAVTRGIIKVHPTRKAPKLRAEQVAAKDSQATEAQEEAARTGTEG